MIATEALADSEPVADVAASFATVLEDRFEGRPLERFVLLLSGGSTAAACYGQAAKAARIDWSLVDLYMGDERLVPADDPDANQRLVREQILDRVARVGSFTPMPTDGEPERCAAAYDATLAELIDGPGIDVIHLGLGPDGHTASLFAGTPSLAVDDRLAIATRDPSGRNPHERLSVTYPLIATARLALFTVAGPEKRDAVARIRSGDDVPAARVSAREVLWLIDAQAQGAGAES